MQESKERESLPICMGAAGVQSMNLLQETLLMTENNDNKINK